MNRKAKLLRKFSKNKAHYKKLKRAYTVLSWIAKTKISVYIKEKVNES